MNLKTFLKKEQFRISTHQWSNTYINLKSYKITTLKRKRKKKSLPSTNTHAGFFAQVDHNSLLKAFKSRWDQPWILGIRQTKGGTTFKSQILDINPGQGQNSWDRNIASVLCSWGRLQRRSYRRTSACRAAKPWESQQGLSVRRDHF